MSLVGLLATWSRPAIVHSHQRFSRSANISFLDTFGAMISGARMKPGELAVDYVRSLGGIEQATVVVSGFRTTATNAALANAMCAHADETDDFEPVTKAHPGCSAVPAALAVAEKEGRSGEEFLRAVALGYDLACRLLMALGPDLVRGPIEMRKGRVLHSVLLEQAHLWLDLMRRACASPSHMRRNRCPACGAG